MPEQDREKDQGSSTGEAVGRKVGGELGKKAGAGAGRAGGSAAAGAGSSAAGAGASAAGGTAAGTAAGAGGAAAAGAGAGAAAGSVVPGAGTAAGAAAGAVVGKNIKRISIAALGCVGGCGSLLFILPAILIAVFLSLFPGFGGTGSALTPGPGGGSGLSADFCEANPPGGDDTRCSEELRKIILAAESAFGVPAGVIAGVLTLEGPHVFAYEDPKILEFSAPGGKDTDSIGRYPNPPEVRAAEQQIGCTVSVAAAVGPMQILFPEAAILLGLNPEDYDTWLDLAEPARTAIGDGRTVHPCNIKDAIFAGAKLLKDKSDSGDRKIWNKEEVYKAASFYSGAPLVEDGCFPAPTVNYCQIVWMYYISHSARPIDDGTNQIPNGWPTSGYIESLFGLGGYRDGGYHYGLDIATRDGLDRDVYSALSGILIESVWRPNCAGQIRIQNTSSGYTIKLLHLSYEAYQQWQGREGDLIPAGTKMGRTYLGTVDASCSSGSHLHYEVYDDGVLVDPMPFTPGANRDDPVEAGGGNWVPQP